MNQLMNVRLSRVDASPWGFRLQGGKDFGQPLLIQKVNGGSPAERAGLQVGDALVRVNGVDVQDMRHKEAQDTIVRAGNNFEVSVQRGGVSTWKPHVASVGNVPAPGSVSSLPVTKTSLAAKPSTTPIPSGHNVSPRPFGTSSPQLNGGDVKAVVNKQYNSPIGVYSEETIAETLSAQTEVLATGALGVNFMKNEKSYDSQKSEVFKMVQEVDHEPREPEPETIVPNFTTPVLPSVAGLRHVAPPEAKPPMTSQLSTPSSTNPLAPGQNICADCERLIVHAVGGRATSPRPLTPIARQMGGPPELPQDKPYMPPPSPLPGSPLCSECGKHIVGVFVRIKDKNLHVECFKCATCGTSLKNVGYYTINNKLYCDIHAKMVARQNPPAPNLDPITIPPGGRIPTGTISSPVFQPTLPSAIARAPTNVVSSPPASLPTSFPPSLPTAGPQSPQPGTLAPLPFHTPNAPALKPFGSVTAPAPPPATVPFNPSSLSSNFGSTKQTACLTPRDAVVSQQTENDVTNLNPVCCECNNTINRGPFITALGKIWCPDHFVCVNPKCKRPLQDIGFVEEDAGLYCEFCFEQYLAPPCDKCRSKIKGDCLNAIGKHFHPECFKCSYCEKLFGNNPFFLEDGLPYCENDWNELFTTKCFSCGFPIEAGDRWVEALNNNYHSQCFNCTMCKKNLDGQSFFAKGGRPFCKNHAR